MPRVASNALSRSAGSLEIFKLATPSTLMLMNSLVGMDSRVLISTWKTFNDNLSFLCKKGNFQPACPLKIFLFPKPEIIIASSGPALVYEQSTKTSKSTTANTIIRINTNNDILKSSFIITFGYLPRV